VESIRIWSASGHFWHCTRYQYQPVCHAGDIYDSDSYSDANSNGYTRADADAHTHAHAYAYAYADTNAYANIYT
jgi:hypothetical protein